MANLFLHRFPFCPQHDSMQCGAACLQMVCLHYGHRYTLDYLSNACAATTEGVSLYGMKIVAEELGFRTQCVKTTVEQLSQTTAPCILHWNQNHFVVLYKNKRGLNGLFMGISVDFSKPKKEEFFISYTSKHCSKAFDFCIK